MTREKKLSIHCLLLCFTVVLALGATSAQAQPTILGLFTDTDGAFPGDNPCGALTLSGSTLYGTTQYGGANNYGVIFSISTSGGTPTILFTFDGTNGSQPEGTLILSGSTLFGTTNIGGANNKGTVFSLPITGGTPKILYNFDGTNHGSQPNGSLTLSGTTLYGTTGGGGSHNYGTVFSLTSSGPSTPKILCNFDWTHGAYPNDGLALRQDGSTLYGATYQGGAGGIGTIFSIATSAVNLTPTVLYNFVTQPTPSVGGYPTTTPMLSGSTLYQVMGGYNAALTGDWGHIFSLPTTGGTPTVLVSFTGSNGEAPVGTLALSGSTFYGMTCFGGPTFTGQGTGNGTVYCVPITGGTPTTLFTFNGADGNNPESSLTVSGAAIYGCVIWGGIGYDGTFGSGYGTIFSNAVPPVVDFTVTVTTSPTTGGSVILTPSQATYHFGDTPTITASAAPNFKFSGWGVSNGSVSGETGNDTLTISGNVYLTANFTAETFTATAVTSTTWVYQNTRVTTADRHQISLTVNLVDTWGNTSYTATVSQTGPGVVTPALTWVSGTTVTPTGADPVVWTVPASTAFSCYLIGGRVSGAINSTANLNLTGSCTLTVTVQGDVSGPANLATTPEVTIFVRPLGGMAGANSVTTTDKNDLNSRLNGGLLGWDPNIWNLDGISGPTTTQKNILNTLLNGVALP